MSATNVSHGARPKLLLASLVLLGCSNNPEALYARDSGHARDLANTRDAAREPTPAESTPAEPTPYESALRVYGDDATCVACVEQKCETQARACADDEDCAKQAACRSQCDGPACVYWECREPYPYHEQPTASLEQCLLDQCRYACRVGQDFDCAGKYADVALDESNEVTTTLQLTDFLRQPRGAGWRARGCLLEDPECTDFVSTTTSDAAGIVEVVFPFTRYFSGALRLPEGYVEVLEPEGAMLTLIFLGDRELPRALAGSNRQPIPIPATVQEDRATIAAVYGREQDRTKGGIGAVVWDCRMSTIAPALGVQVEVDPRDASTWEAYGFGGTSQATDTSGLAIVGNAPPGRVTVSARFQGEVVASSTVLVRADGLTDVWLIPPPR